MLNYEDRVLWAKKFEKKEGSNAKQKELDSFRQYHLQNFRRVVCWFHNDEIKFFFPTEVIKEVTDEEYFKNYDAHLKEKYKYEGIEISSFYAVKYQLPYLVSDYPMMRFEVPKKLKFVKAGASTLFNLHYLYDDNSFIKIGHESKDEKIKYHNVVIPYHIYYDWRSIFQPAIQQKMF